MSSDFPSREELRAMKPAPPPAPPSLYTPTSYQPPRRRRIFSLRRWWVERKRGQARIAESLQRTEDDYRRRARAEVDSKARWLKQNGPAGLYVHTVFPVELEAPGWRGHTWFYGRYISASTMARYIAAEYRSRGLSATIHRVEESDPPAGSDHSGGRLVFPGGDNMEVHVTW